MGVKETLSKQLGNSEEYVAIATVEASKYQETNIDVIAYLTNTEHVPGVYVTLNKPFDKVAALLKKRMSILTLFYLLMQSLKQQAAE